MTEAFRQFLEEEGILQGTLSASRLARCWQACETATLKTLQEIKPQPTTYMWLGKEAEEL